MQIKVHPLDFENYRKFFPHLSNKEIVEFYAVTGGVPKYIELLDFNQSIFENIENKILNENNPLYREPRIILRDEIGEPATFFSVLQVISAGDHKIGNISNKLGIQAKDITSLLDKLRSLEVLERQVPITELNPVKSKMGLYFIKDNFFNFWFRYLFPYQDELEIGNTDLVMEKIKQDFSFFVSFVFEKICIEYVQKNKAKFNVQRVGRYWNKGTEIDVTGIGEEKVLFGECKWKNEPISFDILLDLQSKSKEVLKGTNKTAVYALFSKSGFSENLKEYVKTNKDIYLFNIDEMFNGK